MRQKRIYLVIALLGMLICGLFGYYLGTYMTLSIVIDMGLELLEHEKIYIDIDKQMIMSGILQYKENIRGCLFLEDALVHNNTWDQT